MNLYVSRSTQTSTDVLLAVGLASLFVSAGCDPSETTIREYGPFYEVTLPDGPYRRCSPLQTTTDYRMEDRLATRQAFYERMQTLASRSPEGIRTWRLSEGLDWPGRFLDQYLALLHFSAARLFDSVVSRWNSLDESQQGWHLDLLQSLFSAPFRDLEEGEQTQKRWKAYAQEQAIIDPAEVNALQVLNPSQGKGANRAKADGNVQFRQMKSFWLIEFLKFVGFFSGAITLRVTDGSEDYKLYVPGFVACTMMSFHSIIEEVRELCWSTTPIKQDIRVVAHLARHHAGGSVFVTHYKHMKSYIVLGTYQLPLSRRQSLLRVAERLDETKGEERRLLQSCRDALADDNEKYLAFASSYGVWLSSHPDRACLTIEL
jgi:hypothetical protein